MHIVENTNKTEIILKQIRWSEFTFIWFLYGNNFYCSLFLETRYIYE